jgi:multidrug resistance efflux pump
MWGDSPWTALLRLVLGIVFVLLGGSNLTTHSPETLPALPQDGSTDLFALEVPGRTQCILAKQFTITPVPLHPVTEVWVSRVKKGQRLVKLDDDEAQADVRAKEATLENTQIAWQEARRTLEQVEKHTEAIPEQRYHEIRVAALKAERDERAAKAALKSAKAELEHYEVKAQIDGVVSWLQVHPGMVSRPGTTIWGEILDLREVDVRCELTLEQLERVGIGQSAEIRKRGKHHRAGDPGGHLGRHKN